MAYIPEYTGDDFGAIIIDLLAKIAVVVIGFASVIGLILLYKWYKSGAKVRLG